MRWSDAMALAACLLGIGCGGCIVHDRHAEEEPIWWPNGVVRESTLAPSNGHVNAEFAPYFYLPPVDPPGPLP